MDSVFHLLCPRYSGPLTPTAPTAVRLWESFTFLSHRSVFNPPHRTCKKKTALLTEGQVDVPGSSDQNDRLDISKYF